MPSRVASPTLVGRREELSQLRTVLERAERGEPAIVLVGGDAGVGKTRLLGELTHEARGRGALAVSGGCLELGEGVLPFAPVEDALRELERALGGQRFDALLRGREQQALRSLRGLEASTGDLVQEPDPARMFSAVAALLGTLAEDQPVVLVLEDLHWADRSTLDLLLFLARRLRHGRLALLGTYRTDELHRRHPLRAVLAELARAPSVERLQLEPLAREHVVDQLAHILGEAPPSDLVEEVADRSEGNPFYVEELIAWRRAAGVGPLPPTLRDIMVARLDRLAPDTRLVLRVAAAAGHEVDPRLVEAVAQLPRAEATARLRNAVDEAIVAPAADGHAFRFRHALLREAVYDELLPGEHGPIHRAIAETLEQRPELARTGPGGRAAELAHHWHAAHDFDRAFTASLDAARAASDVFAHAEALRHTERALELHGRIDPEVRASAPPRWQLLRDAADHATRRGEMRRAVAHLQAALDTAQDAPASTRAAVLTQLSYVLGKRGDGEAALEASGRAMDVLSTDEPTPELAAVLAGHSTRLMLLDRQAEAMAVARRAIDVAQATGVPREESDARNTLGAALTVLGDPDEGVRQLERALAIAEEIGAVHLVLRAYVNLTFVLTLAARPERSLEWGAAGLAWVEKQGLVGVHPAFLRLNQVQNLWQTGRWQAADEQVRQVGDLGDENVVMLHHAMSVGRLRAWQGRFRDARQLVQRARRLTEGSPGPQFVVGTAIVEVELALLERDLAGALAAYGRLEELDVPPLYHVETPVVLLAQIAADMAESGEEVAGDLRGRVGTQLERAGADLAEAPPDSAPARLLAAGIRTAEAELGRARGEPDPSAWADAIAATVRIGHRPREAYLRSRRAEALLAVGADRDEAETELAASRKLARGMGAAPIVDVVDDLARRGRIALPGMPAHHGVEALGLTPREQEVLAQVVHGRSNREIGQALFISQKTASVHVSNILGKLDVSSRGEAAAVARRLGIA